MIVSMWSWLYIAEQSKRIYFIRAIIAASATLIAVGAVWCQLTVRLFPGKVDSCPHGPEPLCDAIMATGEGIFYFIWGAVWFVVAGSIHGRCRGTWEKTANWLAAIFLALGPWQILMVSGIPLLIGGEGITDKLYCSLRTGVTYIVAVLLCHANLPRVPASAPLERKNYRVRSYRSVDA
eukprot:gnl/TRDRNA2_/TRDRNA2_174696_c1_seq10.p1 gnl/TRDRNA2_/TRDRNA2_174696_c1~~gnl/TRDRNA2_/TRDRNA2_174696_c1_seq10.p1  ORF type:complete len:179 (+),score=15.55 gnl/TRDRNA2_/TRDRNA2_174696_c1_seq10:209-745(+)